MAATRMHLAPTIEMERTLARLRTDLAEYPRLTRRERAELALSALRRLRREKGEAYATERSGHAVDDRSAFDGRYDVSVIRRYIGLLAAEHQRGNLATADGRAAVA